MDLSLDFMVKIAGGMDHSVCLTINNNVTQHIGHTPANTKS